MQINDELIAYLEGLSKLKLENSEKEKAKKDLRNILEYIEQLGELDTEAIAGLCNPHPGNNAFREDEVVPSFPGNEMLCNAPRQKDGYYLVPKTVE